MLSLKHRFSGLYKKNYNKRDSFTTDEELFKEKYLFLEYAVG